MKQLAPALSDFQVADAYWRLPYDQRTFKKVRELLETTLTENQLSTVARAYEARGLVRHTVLPEDAPNYLPLLPELEDRLRRRFGLRDVVVVDASVLRQAHVGASGFASWKNKDDDLLHDHLGRWAGRVLASLVRPGDTVGTGGGRGPYYTALNCTIPPLSTYPKLVSSLTGFVSAGMWREDRDRTDMIAPRDLDADRVASLLHIGLGTKDCPPRLLNCSITANRPPPETDDVTVAVIGIGALGGGHRLKRLKNFGDLEPVKTLVMKLNAEAEQAEQLLREKGPFYHCVGDVCNSYFVLEEVRQLVKASVRKRLETLIGDLNKRFVNTPPEVFARICKNGVVMAVAGGPHKTGAITNVLRNQEKESPWITHLITDDEVARHILQAE